MKNFLIKNAVVFVVWGSLLLGAGLIWGATGVGVTLICFALVQILL